MKAFGPTHKICRAMAIAALTVCSISFVANAATGPEDLVQSKLGGGTILNTQAQKLTSAVHDAVNDSPQQSAAIVTVVLKGGRADADAIAAPVVTAAIQGLGNNPSDNAVGKIVFAAVKATPDSVLDIVRAAVKADPSAAKTIAKAAYDAVPNQNEMIATAQGSNGDGKDYKDYKAPLDQKLLPIAEAIAEAAGLPDTTFTTPNSPPVVYDPVPPPPPWAQRPPLSVPPVSQ